MVNTYRPTKRKRQDQFPPVRVGKCECISTQHLAGGVPEGAWTGAGDIALVLLQTQPEERITLCGTTSCYGWSNTTPTTLATRQFTTRIRHFQDLQFEKTGAIRALKQKKQKHFVKIIKKLKIKDLIGIQNICTYIDFVIK